MINKANKQKFAKVLLAKAWEIHQRFPPSNIQAIQYHKLVYYEYQYGNIQLDSYKYMLKHCRECFMRYKAQGCAPSALFCVKHKQGNAFTILKNFQRNASI